MLTKPKKKHKLWSVEFKKGKKVKEGFKYYPCTGKGCFECKMEKMSVEMCKEYKLCKAKKRD